VKRINYYILGLISCIFFISTSVQAQTANFDETWKEFLENNKISNMSELPRPDKNYKKLAWAKYLLMNTNTSFCQSDVKGAEILMAEIQSLDPEMHKAIPGFVKKKDELSTKIKAFYSMDKIWKRFLKTREVSEEELEAVAGAKTSCEKKTLAKYSYMTAYYHLCQGDIDKSRTIFQTRTLRLAEKTSLRVKDVEGLASEVANMKKLYKNMAKLETVWRDYVKTGESQGFGIELPFFPCYPIPTIKAMVLNGAMDLCNTGPTMVEKIKELQTESGVVLKGDVLAKVKDLKSSIGKNKRKLAALDKAWAAFIPDNEVKHFGKYGYEYCDKESLIRAYIMDGFAFVCEMADEVLEKIDALQAEEVTELDEVTMTKINELVTLKEDNQYNAVIISDIWGKFVSQGDQLSDGYESAEFYCDNIDQVKDWAMQGLIGSCEDGVQYLELIEDFQNRFEFNFFEDLECRVQKLRIKNWDCRRDALQEMASIGDAESAGDRLEKLMDEYKMGDRPDVWEKER